MNIRKSSLKYGIILLLVNLIFFYIAITKYQQDIYAREVDLSEMSVSSEAADYVSMQSDANGTYLTVTPNNSYYGQIIIGPYISVPEGEYELLINYSSSSSDVVCEVYSGSVVNADNSTGQSIASATLPVGNNTYSLHYTATEKLNSVEFKFYYNGGEFSLYSITNQSATRFTDAFFILGVILFFELSGILIYYFCKKKLNGNMTLVVEFVLLTALAFIASIPILNDFHTNTMDHMIHFERIDNIADWFRNISFHQPVMRLAGTAHNQYGYITPVMYPQLFLYFPALLRLAGCSMLYAYKIMVFFANCATAYIAYFSFTRITKNRQIGLLSTALYTMSLYRLMDFYTRGAIGESIAMIFFPLILYGIYEIFYGDYHKWIYVFLGYTGVIQSHILSTFMVTLFCFIVFLFSIKVLVQKKERIFSLIKAAVCTFISNLWFLVPFLQYHQLNLIINNNGSDLDLSGVYLSQVFSSFINNSGFNQFTGSTANEMPLTLGTIVLIGIILFLYYLYVNKNCQTPLYRLGLGCLLLGIISLFISSTFFPWNSILATGLGSHLHAIQYAWRFLAIAALFFSLISAIGFFQLLPIKNDAEKYTSYYTLALIGVIIFSSFYYIDSNIPLESQSKAIAEVTREMDELYLPEAARNTKDSLSGTVVFSEDCECTISNITKEYAGLSIDFTVNTTTPDSYMDLPLFYYPDYKIIDENGQVIPYTQSPKGLIRISLSTEMNYIHAYYVEPLLWRISSVISILFILFMIIYYKKLYH
ncbi:MAG: 6-pyruvoyl-tetrahydropterin synthase-related protein [Lachnospiraceae bacterium]|nr:6-pyruvoyl-tetrahydropterin synthase-related protein [Lachnospiraceae bacterium]